MSGGVSGSYVSISDQLGDGAVSEAKLAAQACSAAKMKQEGNAGEILTSNGVGAVPSYQAAGAISNNVVKIATTTLGAANAYCSVSGITAGTYTHFFLSYDLGITGTTGVGIRINVDTTSNYIGGHVSRVNTSIAATDLASTYLQFLATNAAANDSVTGTANITNIATGYRYIQNHCSRHTTGSAEYADLNGTWKSATEVSSIDLWATASTFKIGSTMTLWGVKP